LGMDCGGYRATGHSIALLGCSDIRLEENGQCAEALKAKTSPAIATLIIAKIALRLAAEWIRLAEEAESKLR
jgi:hypothetical protein